MELKNVISLLTKKSLRAFFMHHTHKSLQRMPPDSVVKDLISCEAFLLQDLTDNKVGILFPEMSS